MKRLSFLMLALLAASSIFSQSEKYTAAMQQKLIGFDSVRNNDNLLDLANAFERIADAEKTQWLPYYYAALSNVRIGYNHAMSAGPLGGNADKVDPLADKAEAMLNKAEALSKDNSEIYVVRKMIASMRMMGDIMNRYMTYGPLAADALATAKKLNPDNPRVYVLEATDQFNTPEQYGGSKTEAKRLFDIAVKKFETFKPASPIDPDWGRGQMMYFMGQL
jgi:hypothetical protein